MKNNIIIIKFPIISVNINFNGILNLIVYNNGFRWNEILWLCFKGYNIFKMTLNL